MVTGNLLQLVTLLEAFSNSKYCTDKSIAKLCSKTRNSIYEGDNVPDNVVASIREVLSSSEALDYREYLLWSAKRAMEDLVKYGGLYSYCSVAGSLIYRASIIKPVKQEEKEDIYKLYNKYLNKNPWAINEKRPKTKKQVKESKRSIDEIVEIIKTKYVPKSKILEMAGIDNMLSVAVQINSRLKKQSLKIHKKKIKGETHYGVK